MMWILKIVFIICCYLTIRWSEIPVICECDLLNFLFVHNKEVDAAALNVVTGYLTGYFVYILTVVIPTAMRYEPVKEVVISRLVSIYQKSVYLLLLMYKNCCSQEEWKKILEEKQDDIQCLDDKFYQHLSRFDIVSEADTILLHKKSKKKLKWYEYLNEKYEVFYEEMNEIFIQYHIYLDDDILNLIANIKDSTYYDAFLGKGRSTLVNYEATDGYEYYEDIPLVMVYDQNIKGTFFENNNALKEYVNELTSLHDYLVKCEKKKELKSFDKNYGISKLKKMNVGHAGCSIIKSS